MARTTKNPTATAAAVEAEQAAATIAEQAGATVMETSDNAASSDSENGDVVGGAATRGKKRATPLDRLAQAVEALKAVQQCGGQNRANAAKLNKAIATLERLQGTLGTAKIVLSKKSRSPNDYNQFVSEHMQSLKEANMTSTEKFRHCIQLWNQHKAEITATAAQAIVPEPTAVLASA